MPDPELGFFMLSDHCCALKCPVFALQPKSQLSAASLSFRTGSQHYATRPDEIA